MEVDEVGTDRNWEVSVQATKQKTSCARCNNIFDKGELRLRPAGTTRTRLVHPACAHGLVHDINSVVNVTELADTQRSQLQQALAHAIAVPGGPGDVPHPILDPATAAAVYARGDHDLRNLQQWDLVPWERAAECPATVRRCPVAWEAAMLDAKVAVMRGIEACVGRDEGHTVHAERLWKLLSMFDALMFCVAPRKRGGKRGQGAHTMNALYSSRLRSFWAGAWTQLLSELDVAQQVSLARPVNRSPQIQIAKDASIVQSLFQHEAVSKALSRATSPMEFARGEQVPAQLQAKFPRVLTPLPPQPPAAEIPVALKTELVEHISSELSQLPKMCGAGPNGTFYEHINITRAIPGGLQLTARVIAMLITGEAHPNAIRLHRSGRCHPSIKPDTGGDIRPLVSSSAYWRTGMRGWVRMFKEEARDAVGPTQFGVARPGGCVALHHELLAHMLKDPDLALASIDLENMYGNLDISNIEKEVIHRIPRMWPLLRPWIREPREHVYRDDQGVIHRIDAPGGLDQGDPSSAILAPLGITTSHETLSAHGKILGEIDDTYLLLKPNQVKDGLEALAGAFRPAGGRVKPSKSSIWCSVAVDTGISGIQQTAQLPPVLKQPLPTVAPDGTTLVFSAAPFVKVLDDRRRSLDRLHQLAQSGLPLQTALVLARFCTAGDAVYMSQCQSITDAQAAQLDDVTLAGVRGLLKIAPHESQARPERWFLPWKDGGMGFLSVTHAAKPNFLAGWVRDLSNIAGAMGQPNAESVLRMVGPLQNCLQTVVDGLTASGVEDLPTLASAFEFSGQSKLASHWRLAVSARTRIQLNSGGTAEHIVAVRASSGSGAGAWMGVPRQQNHFLTDQEVVTSVRLRMCMDVFDAPNGACLHHNRQTVCGAALDTLGAHALLCRLGGHVVKRHNRLRDTLAAILREVLDTSVHVEQHPAEIAEDERRPDISFLDHRGMRQWIDVAVVTPHPRSLPGQATMTRTGALCESMEATKRRKYNMLSLYPGVMEHLGHMGEGLMTLLRSVHRDVDPFKRSMMVDSAYQTMAAALQRENVTLLAAAGSLKM